MAQLSSSQLSPIYTDTITRVYKNQSGAVIGIQEVIVMETRAGDGYGTIIRTAILNSPLTLVSEGQSQLRVIGTIQQLGEYDSFTESGGDFTEVVYSGSGNLDDLTVDLTGLPSRNDTI